MTDETILKLCKETTALLQQFLPGFDASAIVPSYNAILDAAKENHPNDRFINALTPIESVDTSVELSILYMQLRIAIEAGSEDISEAKSDNSAP